MSIKRIIVFVLLAVLIYSGVYITVFGIGEYIKLSGTERIFSNRAEELSEGLNITGSVETVTAMLGSEDITRTFLGIKVGGTRRRYYFALPLGYAEDISEQKYCVISVVDPKDVEALNALLKKSPAPLDPNAPRFEFRGLVLGSSLDVQTRLTGHLREVYTPEIWVSVFGGALPYNVNRYIAPYTIHVKTDVDDNYPMTITIGLIVTLVGAGLFILLAIRTYRKAHLYD